MFMYVLKVKDVLLFQMQIEYWYVISKVLRSEKKKWEFLINSKNVC